jgi:hypothetical protein
LLSNQKNMQWLEFTAFDCRNARSASGMGQTLLSHPVLVWVNVCCSPEQPFREQVANDAKGQTRTSNHVGATSALPLVTAKWRTLLRVRKVPTSEVAPNKNLGTRRK